MVALVVVSGLAPAVAAAPSLDVTVEHTSVEGGETITVTDDPQVDIEASGDAAIESVEIRVDGERRQSFEPNAESFSERITLDLDDGEHEVTVVAEGSGTTERTATVRKDSHGPRVSYTSPFTTERGQPSGTVRVETADATIAGELYDLSGVERVRIERSYEWTFAGRSETQERTKRVMDPGDNFSVPMLLGLGENTLNVQLMDVHGQRRTHEITVDVVDGQKPAIQLDRFERNGNQLDVEGVVSDNVKVKSLSVRAGSGEKSVLVRTSKEPDRERLSTEFSFSVRVDDDTEEITLVATDVAGNTREWAVPLDYRGHVAPTVSIDADGTRIEDGSVAVSGMVTDGQVQRVVVETVGPDGATVSTATVYDGDVTGEVAVQARLRAADGETTVVVRAVDADGREHEQTLRLGGERAATTEATAGATTAAPSTPAPTDAPSTPVTTTVSDGPGGLASLGAASTHLPMPVALPVPLSIPLPVPFAGSIVVVAVLGLVMAVSNVTAIEAADATAETAAAGSDRPASGGERTGAGGGADAGGPTDAPAPGRDPAPRDRAGGGTSRGAPDDTRPAAGPGGPDRRAAEPRDDPRPDRTAEGQADDPVAAGGAADASEDVTADPEPAFDVTDHLGVASMADVGDDEVADLVASLDADGDEAADAARGLAAIAGERPELLAGTEAESRLRDLRLDPDPAVSDAASTAVQRLTDADD
jgi:hypothetical protein